MIFVSPESERRGRPVGTEDIANKPFDGFCGPGWAELSQYYLPIRLQASTDSNASGRERKLVMWDNLY